MNIKNIFKKKKNLTEDEKAERFWSWFQKSQNRFLFLSDIDGEEKENLLDEFLTEIHKFNENVYFEIGGHKDDEKVELIISAEGDIDYLSLDLEGAELDFLKSIDFNNIKINVITVEHNFEFQRDQIYKLLTNNGFNRVFEEISQQDDSYINKQFLNFFSD